MAKMKRKISLFMKVVEEQDHEFFSLKDQMNAIKTIE